MPVSFTSWVDMATLVDTHYLLEQFYEALRSGSHFMHAHSYSSERGNLYADLGSTIATQLYRARKLMPVPKMYPAGLMFYREMLHHHLAINPDYLSGLATKKRNLDLYFRDIEKIVRLTYEQLLIEGDWTRGVQNKQSYQVSYAISRHVPYWYLRGMSLPATIAHLTGSDPYNPDDMERIEDAIWAVDLACAYVGAYLDIEFHSSHIVMADKGPWACEYSTRQCNIIYEAGYHLARHITTQVSPHMEALGASHAQLSAILSDEMAMVALQQSRSALIPDMDKAETISLLVKDAVTQYEPTLLYNLKKRCEELSSRQQQATHAMQVALSGTVMQPVKVAPITARAAAADDHAEGHAWSDNMAESGDFKALMRDLEAEQGMDSSIEAAPEETSLSARLGETTNATVIEAGETIIEYLKRMTFSAPDRSEEKDIMDTTNSSGGDDETAEEKAEELAYSMEFECYIEGQGKVRKKLQDLLAAVQAGLQITFASQAQAKAFTKTALTYEPKAAANMSGNQVRYVEKGQAKDMGQEPMQQMKKECEPLAQKVQEQRAKKQEQEPEKDKAKEPQQQGQQEGKTATQKLEGESTAQKLTKKPGRSQNKRWNMRQNRVQHALQELSEVKEQGVSVGSGAKKPKANDVDGDGVPDVKPMDKGRGR